MPVNSYVWWEDDRYKSRVIAEMAIVARLYGPARFVINDHGRLAARMRIRGRIVIYTVEAEYADNFPAGALLGRVLDPDLTGLDSLRDHVLHPDIVCAFHDQPHLLSGAVVLRTITEWIRRYGERHFG